VEHDIRWIQRFSNYQKAFSQLEEAVSLSQTRELSRLEKQGMIQAFEYTHELAWKVMKDFLTSRGALEIYGSRDATREAFKTGLISNGEVWMDMIKSRNLTSHTYDESTVEAIVEQIVHAYLPEFDAFKSRCDVLAVQER